MEINKNIAVFRDALETIEEGIDLFYEYQDIFEKQPSDKNEQLFKSMRDSLIQRFEYCTDLFWKVTKVYLIEVEKISVAIQSPRGIIREAIKARLFSGQEVEACMDMVEARNKTLHTYLEVMADKIAYVVPVYYKLMKSMIDRIQSVT